MNNARADEGLSMEPIRMLDEATGLLRRCGPWPWVWWVASSAPFAIGLFRFIDDMARSATAPERITGAALKLALLYWAMKVGQAFFGAALLRTLRGGGERGSLSLGSVVRLVCALAWIACTLPWVLGVSLVLMAPFGWAFTAYHNASILAVEVFQRGGRMRDLVRLAVAESHDRWLQNHLVIIFLGIFALIVWLNLHVGLGLGAALLSVVSGEENVLTRNPAMLLGTPVVAGTVLVSYLLVGPWVRAVHALRCFRSLSKKNGEDLRIAFRRAGSGLAIAGVAGLLWLGFPGALVAADAAGSRAEREAAPAPSRIAPERLEQGIRRVLEEEKFHWRVPGSAREAMGPVGAFFSDIADWILESVKRPIKRGWQWLKEWLDRLFDRLFKDPAHRRSGREGWSQSVPVTLKVLSGLMVVLLGVGAVVWYRRRRRGEVVPTVSGASFINLESGELVASQLPSEEWLRLAEAKVATGELRLAMRAVFLATLAILGERELVRIGKSKSNGDYLRELSARTRDRVCLGEWFREEVRFFDWAWYGCHEVSWENFERFRANHQRIMDDATAK
jgi:hypothetical protein